MDLSTKKRKAGREKASLGEMRDWGRSGIGGPVLTRLVSRSLSHFLNYLLSLVNNVQMTKTRFPISMNS